MRHRFLPELQPIYLPRQWEMPVDTCEDSDQKIVKKSLTASLLVGGVLTTLGLPKKVVFGLSAIAGVSTFIGKLYAYENRSIEGR